MPRLVRGRVRGVQPGRQEISIAWRLAPVAGVSCIAMGTICVASDAAARPTAASSAIHVAIAGNDANDGSIFRPVKSLSQAIGLASTPGAEVVVHAGVYAEHIVLDHSGTPEAHIWVHAAAGERAIIDGSGLADRRSLVEIRGSFVKFEGFEVRSGSGNCIDVSSPNSTISNDTIHDCDQQGITVEGGADNSTVENNTVYNNVRANSTNPGAAGAGWGQGISFAGVSGCTCKGNKVYQNWGEGIGAQKVASNITIENNVVYDNFSCEIYIDSSSHCTVAGNLTYFTGDTRFVNPHGTGPEGLATAIETSGGSLDGNVYINNIDVGDNSGFRWWNESSIGGLVNNVIANNTFINEKEANIQIDSYSENSGNTLVNNIFYQSSGTLQSGEPAGTASNNAWFGGSAGSFAGSGDVTADPQLVNAAQACTAGSCSADAYKLQAGSPLASAGKAVSQVTTDYWGTARAGSYSIGAYQPTGGGGPSDGGPSGSSLGSGSSSSGGSSSGGSSGRGGGSSGSSGQGGSTNGGASTTGGGPSGDGDAGAAGDSVIHSNSSGCGFVPRGASSRAGFAGLLGLAIAILGSAARRRRRG